MKRPSRTFLSGIIVCLAVFLCATGLSQEKTESTPIPAINNDPVEELRNAFADSFDSAYRTLKPAGSANTKQIPEAKPISRQAKLVPPPTSPKLVPEKKTSEATWLPPRLVRQTSAATTSPTKLRTAPIPLTPKPLGQSHSNTSLNQEAAVYPLRGDSILTKASSKAPVLKTGLSRTEPNVPQSWRDDSDISASWHLNMSSDPVWWRPQVHQPIYAPNSPKGIDANSLVYETLRRSPRISALSQNPLIRDLQIVEADSDFDPVSFVNSQFQDRVDPVGDSLSITNDGSAFLQDHIWNANAGVRKKTRTGASYELSQQLGFKNSNSSFFTPQDQGTATLALNVTQPLLRGRGRYINQTQILIAQSAFGGAWNTFAGELQDEIQTTVDAYWRLYYDRSVYLQKRRNVERGEAILRTLEGRAGLDSLPSQIARARSAVQSRKTDLANALRDIRDSETELRRITADRNWQANQSIELIPMEPPRPDAPPLGLENVVYTALENRPEIKEVMSRSKIASLQQDISRNELLPELSLLLGTYVSALEGESQLGQAIQNQFGEVKPGYNVGFEFELPFRNRAARSRFAQRRLQVAKIRAEIDEVIQNVIAESQVSLRRIQSAKQTMDAAFEAIRAARSDLEQNFRRWESFALVEGDLADGQTPTTVLDQLLDSQERLTSAELVFSQAELELKSAEVGLLRTMGTLLIHRRVNLQKEYEGDLPQMRIGQSRHENRPGVTNIPPMPNGVSVPNVAITPINPQSP